MHAIMYTANVHVHVVHVQPMHAIMHMGSAHVHAHVQPMHAIMIGSSVKNHSFLWIFFIFHCIINVCLTIGLCSYIKTYSLLSVMCKHVVTKKTIYNEH